MRFNDVLNAMIILAVLLIIGFVSGLHVGRTSAKRVTDTITQVQLIERPVTIRDSVHTKSVTIKTKDTIYFLDKPVVIPCGDTSFIAQSDSVITATRDTINMAFAYANRKGHFSLVYRPRPDSIKVIGAGDNGLQLLLQGRIRLDFPDRILLASQDVDVHQWLFQRAKEDRLADLCVGVIGAIEQLVDFDGLKGTLINDPCILVLEPLATNRGRGQGIRP